MPELPEVEAVCRKLRQEALGQTIVRARILRPRILGTQSVDEFERGVEGKRIEAIDRRAKHILIRCSNDAVIQVHLRMTGNLFAVPDVRFYPQETRAHFEFPEHRGILFTDPRALGRIQLHTSGEIKALLAGLGPEPLSDSFTPEWLLAAARQSRQPAKLFLMDQTRIAGLGNIYAAEALFRARIHPRRIMTRLTKPRLAGLHTSIVAVLQDALQSACKAYSSPGRFGEAEDFPVMVYDREGLPCKSCNRSIRRFVQGGRSTYYCPGCQK